MNKATKKQKGIPLILPLILAVIFIISPKLVVRAEESITPWDGVTKEYFTQGQADGAGESESNPLMDL
jgi:hypothetical protein